MHYEEQWREDGSLWTRSHPEGTWWPASDPVRIAALAQRVFRLETQLAERQVQEV